jgi:hypothetical protein
MPFVQEVLRRLSEARVQYCILRNYHSLPHGLNGTDLDLLVNAQDLEAVFQILAKTAPRHGGAFISRYRAEALISSFCGRTAGVWWGVQIDVFPGLTHRGVPFYDARDLLRRAQDWHGLPVAPEGEATVIALLKELLTNSSSRKGYDKQAAVEYVADPESYNKRLAVPFGPDALDAFQRYLARLDSPALMRTAARRLRWALCLRAFWRHPFRLLATKVIGLARRLRRLFRPAGIMLAVVGPDATAKSTLLAKIRPVLEAAVHGHVHTTVAGSNPPGLLGGLLSLLKLVRNGLDYLFSYWLTIYPSLMKRPCIWIFDGYFYDVLFAPLRKGIAPPGWLVRGVALAVPRPDLVICLGARAETLRLQLPELNPAELNRQLARLRHLCQADARAVWIDADGSPEDTADRVLSAVVARASARYA